MREFSFFWEFLPVLGSLILFYRLSRPRERGDFETSLQTGTESDRPFVSIVVPARNEEANLPPLLRSFEKLDYPKFEVIVVDDQSTDRTVAIAESFGVRCIRAPEKKSGWIGKSWACHIGAHAGRGDLLLFTDADTVHSPDSLSHMVEFINSKNLDMASALPYHQAPRFWEKLLGPFWLLALLTNAPYQPPQQKRLFAIGQYLLFRRSGYEFLGGHELVRESLAEDLDLARAALKGTRGYAVFSEAPPFMVRMYSSPLEFFRGWRRLIRVGIGKSSYLSVFEVMCAFAAAAVPWTVDGPVVLRVFLFIVLVGAMAFWQRRHGAFSILGAVFYPISFGLFALITFVAVADNIRGRAVVWRDRSYVYDKSSSKV